MITVNKSKVPVYDIDFEMYVFDTWEELVQIIPAFKKFEKSQGITISNGHNIKAAVKYGKSNICVHESEHVKNFIMDFIGKIPSYVDDEPDAYLITLICDMVYDTYYNHSK